MDSGVCKPLQRKSSPGFDLDPFHGFGDFLCSWLFLKANMRQSRRHIHKNNTNKKFVICCFVATCEFSFAMEQAGKELIQVSGRTCAAGAGGWPNPPSLHLFWIKANKTTTPLWQNHLQLQVCRGGGGGMEGSLLPGFRGMYWPCKHALQRMINSSRPQKCFSQGLFLTFKVTIVSREAGGKHN